jgi:hypothetical protein
MRYRLLFILFIIKGSFSIAQTYDDSQKTDTFFLKNIELKKVIAYRVNSVTILVDYNDFMKTFTPLWKEFRRRVKSLAKDEGYNFMGIPGDRTRFHFLDTTYQNIMRQINITDTAYLDDNSFRFADMGHGFNFDRAIETGKCIIVNKDHLRQNIILRQKYSYQKGMLDGWGGRLYFLSGDKTPFIRGTDWVS